MRTKPSLRVGGTYDNDLGGTRTIGDKFTTWYGLDQYREKAGDRAWWHKDGTPNVTQDGTLISVADVAPVPAPVAAGQTLAPGERLMAVNSVAGTARFLP